MKHLKFILPLFVILFACSPDSDDTAEDTRLELTVLDENSTALENVEVKLYATQEDYYNDTNLIATSTTNASGKVTFENLQPITYFWKTISECYLENGLNNTINPIEENSLNQVSTNIYAFFYGNIIISNGSSYDYQVNYSGPENDELIIPAGTSVELNLLTSGLYSFQMTSSVNSSNHTVNLNCGGQILIQVD